MRHHAGRAVQPAALTIGTVGAKLPRSRPRKTYKAPRTPWGDPDSAGQLHEQVRAGHAVRAAARVRRQDARRHRRRGTAEADRKSAQQTRIERAPFIGGDPEGTHRRRRPSSATSTRSSRAAAAWLVVDPPDGKIPAADARGAAAHRARAARRQQLQQRRRSTATTDLQPLRSLHHARLPGLDDAGHLRQLLPDRAGARAASAIRYEMIHETRVIPLDGRAARRHEHPLVHGRRARPLGRRHARRRDDELHASAAPTATPTPTR